MAAIGLPDVNLVDGFGSKGNCRMKELSIKEIEEVSGADGAGYQVGVAMGLAGVAVATALVAGPVGVLAATGWAAGLLFTVGSAWAFQI
jgi:hypothetical protein